MDKARYEAGLTFDEFLGVAVKNADLWRGIANRAQVSPTAVDDVAALGGHWHLLVLNEDWCGDAVNSVPYAARLAELAANLDLRIVGRDANPDLMDAHLTGTSRSIPVVIVYDEDFVERGWWGPRPRELQRWVKSEGMQLETEPRYRHVRTWYARDRGETTVAELAGVIRAAADSAAHAPR